MTTDTTPHPTPDELDKDPAVSFWLKRNWRMACERDPHDATRDAAVLHHLCETRLKEILGQHELKEVRDDE